MQNLRLGITGADGFLARHLRYRCHRVDDVELSLASRETFKDIDKLCEFVNEADVVVHLLP